MVRLFDVARERKNHMCGMRATRGSLPFLPRLFPHVVSRGTPCHLWSVACERVFRRCVITRDNREIANVSRRFIFHPFRVSPLKIDATENCPREDTPVPLAIIIKSKKKAAIARDFGKWSVLRERGGWCDSRWLYPPPPVTCFRED